MGLLQWVTYDIPFGALKQAFLLKNWTPFTSQERIRQTFNSNIFSTKNVHNNWSIGHAMPPLCFCYWTVWHVFHVHDTIDVRCPQYVTNWTRCSYLNFNGIIWDNDIVLGWWQMLCAPITVTMPHLLHGIAPHDCKHTWPQVACHVCFQCL